MAYNRTKRFPKLISQTSAEIGPGTYNVSDLSCPKRHLAEFSPFLCGSKRKTIIVSKDAERLPGPGSYNIKQPQHHIPGGVSIDFTDARFKEEISEGPGPVDYEVASDVIKCGKIRSHPGTWRGPAGKLWLTRPPRPLIPTPTSVPDKNYAGYSIDHHGSLVKNAPIRKKPTFFYNIPRGERNTTTLMYKGNFWSRMTGRTEPRRFLTPGPGDYQLERKNTASQMQDEKIREERRMSSRQPRFLDTLYRRKMRENFPAPNCYKVKGTFDKYFKIRCKCESYAWEPPPFGQTAKRFDDKIQSDIPGPGTYDPPKPIKCTASIYPAPFGVCSSRFKKDSGNKRPGPSDYHPVVGNLAYELQNRFKYTLGKPILPQTLFDEIPFYEDEEDYNVTCSPERTEEKKSSVYHAAFKSRTERFPKPDKTDVPNPCAYEVLTAFKASRDKCDFLCHRLAPPFGTRTNRLAKRIEVVAPDPTTYKLAIDITENAKGGVINPSPGKIRTPSQELGPAHYCIHPYFSSPLLKRSFNVALGKPKVLANLEKQEKHKGPRCPRTRKRLRWFAKSIREYKTCHSIPF